VSANTTVWLIRYARPNGGDQRAVACLHNAIADYRDIDPDATTTTIDCAAVEELVEAAREKLAELSPDGIGHYRLRDALKPFGITP
jgi:hypothetical protein